MNLAARAGRWSASHWKTAFAAWLVFAALFYVLGHFTGTRKLSDAETGSGEAARAQAILRQADFTQRAGENVLVRSDTLTVSSPVFRRAIRDVERRVTAFPNVTKLRSPLDPALPGLIAEHGHAALIQSSSRTSSRTPVTTCSRSSTASPPPRPRTPRSGSRSSATRARPTC